MRKCEANRATFWPYSWHARHRQIREKSRNDTEFRATKKPASRAGSCWRIGSRVCLRRKPISFIAKETRADPCITAELADPEGPAPK